jgi:hypothetical protein
MSSSSAVHTSGEVRCSRDRLAWQAVVAHESRRPLRRVGRLGEREALDDPRQAVRLAAADDPLEQAQMLVAELHRRVAGAHAHRRVRQAEQIAVGHALAPAVLDRLVGERLGRAVAIPRAHGAAQGAAPTAEALDEGRELEQVRRRAADACERREGGLPCRLVAGACCHRQREDRRVVLRCAAGVAHRDDLVDRPRAVRVDAALDCRCVLTGELPLARVEGAALRAEDQEAAEAGPVVDGPREAAGAVRGLVGARDRSRLGHPSQALEIRHVDTPPFDEWKATVVAYVAAVLR